MNGQALDRVPRAGRLEAANRPEHSEDELLQRQLVDAYEQDEELRHRGLARAVSLRLGRAATTGERPSLVLASRGRKGSFSPNELAGLVDQVGLDRGGGRARGGVERDHHEVDVRREGVLVLAKGLSNEALRPISPDRVADLLGRDDAEPGRAGHLAGDGEHDETSAPRAKGRASLNAQEIGPSQEPIRTREGLVSRGHGGAAGRRSCENPGRGCREARVGRRGVSTTCAEGDESPTPEACYFLKTVVDRR